MASVASVANVASVASVPVLQTGDSRSCLSTVGHLL